MQADWNAVPVAALGPDWLENDFRQSVVELLETQATVAWMLVDSDDEGSFLLNQIYSVAACLGRKSDSFYLTSPDPIPGWIELIGDSEESGDLFEVGQAEVILVHGTPATPVWFWREQLPLLRAIIRSLDGILVLPVRRENWDVMRELCEGDHVLEIPSLEQAQAKVVEELCCNLVCDVFPELLDGPGVDRDDVRRRVVRSIREGRPQSRQTIRIWLEMYHEKITREEYIDLPSAIAAEPPPPAMLADRLCVPIVSRQELSQRFQASLSRVENAVARAKQTIGREILWNMHPMNSPFDSPDPKHWFDSVVSYLSCVVFDAGDHGLNSLLDFSYDASRNDVKGEPLTSFGGTLRVLRTTAQHGLNPRRTKDVEKLTAAKDWFDGVVGVPVPRKDHWRVLTLALIELWESQVSGFETLITKLPVCPSKAAVLVKIDKDAKLPPRVNVAQAFEDVVQELGLTLDAQELCDRYFEDCKNQLKNACVLPREWDSRLKGIAEEFVLSHIAKCPVDGRWLIDNGVPSGPDLGKFHARFCKTWAESAGITSDEFLEDCKNTIRAELGDEEAM
ncbi:hypothetical protein [Bremerella cremea]|uniref:hypothetical protein n=1 Tax=Bremerella cremea TaxID=1031537 RepID=UPI0031E8BDFF